MEINESKNNINKQSKTVDAKVLKSICKIKYESKTILGTGFLLKFYIDQECFYCLISNKLMITQDIINNNIIHIYYDNEDKLANLKLDSNKRYIKNFTDIGLDITVIEILEEDNISKDNFLWFKFTIMSNTLINSKIYIVQKGKELKNVKGEIKEINKYEFTYSASI